MSHSNYYEEKLYQIQDGILRAFKSIEMPFYLTGGTALSRAYYNHRYSDDLDFFVNSDDEFESHVAKAIGSLKGSSLRVDEKNVRWLESFVSLFVLDDAIGEHIKLDFVNDVSSHYGELTSGRLYSKIDSVRNILSNKVAAIPRLSGKDIADIREIAYHEEFTWSDIMTEARNKDLGIDAVMVSDILRSVPKSAFDEVVWTAPAPDWEQFKSDAMKIADDVINVRSNTLFAPLRSPEF